MLTKEEVLDIISYCKEHGVARKDRLISLGISEWIFYKSRRRYLEQEASIPVKQGEFIQLQTSGAFVAPSVTKMEQHVNPGKKTHSSIPEGCIDFECQTVRGGIMRIRGTLSIHQLTAIIQNL